MNLSKVVSALKMELGLYAITLPFKDENGNATPTEKVIMDVLTTMTIPRYSEFKPWARTYDVHMDKLQCIDKFKGVYVLPPFLTITPIKYIKDIRMPDYRIEQYSGMFPGVYGNGRSAQAVINNQAQLLLHGEMRAEPTWEYLGENKVQLYGFPRTVLTFMIAAEHAENGETIPDSCYDSFMELATLDVKVFLYNTLKLYDGIPTAFGNINLKIDEYQSADNERSSLLNEWRDKFHVDDLWEWM